MLHTKLQTGQPGNDYERKANRVAEQLMGLPEARHELASDRNSTLARMSGDDIVRGEGEALDHGVRRFLEPHVGLDLGGVRVHRGDVAAAAATALHARAFTVGRDIAFASGEFRPDTVSGQRLLAHELTHVVQQRSGPVDGTAAGGGVRISDPGDRFEREAATNAERVMSAPAPAVAPGPAVQRHADDGEQDVQRQIDSAQIDSGQPAVQREGEEEEEQVQGSFTDAAVQREGEEEEEPA
jgi:hypothetical protein